MGNGQRSGTGGRTTWPAVLGGAVGAGAGVALGGLVAALADLSGYWPGTTGAGIGAGVGVVLGQVASGRLFRLSSGSPPDHAPQT